MLSIRAASKKRQATEGVGVKRPNKKAKPKRPKGTLFENFTCELDKDNCVMKNGLCIAHNTPKGKSKVKCLVNAEVAAKLTCGSEKMKADFECDICIHVFSIRLSDVTGHGQWCSMCSAKWKHCGEDTCTFCFDRSIASYEGLTLNGKKKVDCIVNKADLIFSRSSSQKVDVKCDVCLHVFSTSLDNVIKGVWCGMCSTAWKHCGEETCTFCFKRSFASYAGLTLKGKKKADCIVNKAELRLAFSSRTKVKFKCDVCLHVFSMRLYSVTCDGVWCGMCSTAWKHCGVVTCTFCFERSLESYERLTLKGKKKADCVVKKDQLRLPLYSHKKVEFICDDCLLPFSMKLSNVTSNGHWCPKCKNKTELKVFKFLLKMKFEVVREYIPGGIPGGKSGTTSLMKQTYGKNGFMDYYLPGFFILFELDGTQHNMEHAFFSNASLFTRMILDKWKEFWARKCGLSVIRFDQPAIKKDDYDWKEEMENILTFTGSKLTNQLKKTDKRYKEYAKQHQNASKRRDIPDRVKWSHQIANTPSTKYIAKYVLAMKPFGNVFGTETLRYSVNNK
jgi:very-short-patch-repair endonuclease